MKIIRTIESFYPFMSGPANQAFRISCELQKQKINSPIYTTTYKAETSPLLEFQKKVKIHRFTNDLCLMKFCINRQFYNAIKKADCDLIHAHNYRSFQTDAALSMARKKHIPFVINTHGSLLGYTFITKGIAQLPYKIYDFITRKRSVMKADAVIVSSLQEFEEAVAFGIPKEKIHAIPMGIDVTQYPLQKKENKKLTLLFVGRISRDRNVEPIIKAIKLLEDEDVVLRIVGKEEKRSNTSKAGYVDELKALAKELGIQKRVIFVGPKYGKDLREEYCKADLFVYTSLYENFGQTILEAGAAGLPVICTRVGVALDIVKDDKTGYLIEGDQRDVEQSVRKLLDKKTRDTFGKEIRSYVKANYDWDKIIQQYKDLYESLIHY